jgi:hypothetical protein
MHWITSHKTLFLYLPNENEIKTCLVTLTSSISNQSYSSNIDITTIINNHTAYLIFYMTSMVTQCILSHNAFWPTPSAMVDPLSSFVHSIYLFFFVKCSRIKSPFIPFLVPLFSLGFLHSWCKNYGHSLMVFLHPLGSKVIKNRRKEVTRPKPFGFK